MAICFFFLVIDDRSVLDSRGVPPPFAGPLRFSFFLHDGGEARAMSWDHFSAPLRATDSRRAPEFRCLGGQAAFPFFFAWYAL